MNAEKPSPRQWRGLFLVGAHLNGWEMVLGGEALGKKKAPPESGA